MFQTIRRFAGTLLKPKPVPLPVLGRWKLDHCTVKTDRRIDYANVDHCGTCGKPTLVRLTNTKVSQEEVKDRVNVVDFLRD